MNPTDKSRLLQQIAAIAAMERGKLSAYSFKERPGVSGPYHKLQYWRDGKNHTRYVSAEELPAVEAALAGHAHYRQLTEQYADLIIEETRQNIAGVKKECPPKIRLAQAEEIQRLIASFQAEEL
ncbi:MAG: hypothetical protein KGJ60_01795 [Verrucomicrobiota bacterium]|nr:hypothetical protein [Verrucomicrobiota bacterium]MDE3066262.1 hypothetical protein [Verrucomicrobiota bacterium]